MILPNYTLSLLILVHFYTHLWLPQDSLWKMYYRLGSRQMWVIVSPFLCLFRVLVLFMELSAVGGFLLLRTHFPTISLLCDIINYVNIIRRNDCRGSSPPPSPHFERFFSLWSAESSKLWWKWMIDGIIPPQHKRCTEEFPTGCCVLGL